MGAGSNYEIIRHLLIVGWDPIGVKRFESFEEDSETEYNSYAIDISDLVASGADRVDIEEYLSWAEKHIDAGTSRSRIKRVAKLICESLELR
jgi:hypothetical protein